MQKHIHKYPHFTTIKTLDDECWGPQLSPDRMPTYQEESHTQKQQYTGKQMDAQMYGYTQIRMIAYKNEVDKFGMYVLVNSNDHIGSN